jgi:mono/diheme cytochrome c family protein
VRRRLQLLVLLLGLAVAGCGSSGESEGSSNSATVGLSNPTAGRKVFAAAGCGSCHTLAAAGAHGTIGTDLDKHPPTVELVLDRVTNGQGGMPSYKDQLSEQQIDDVAAYVAAATH